MVDALKINNVAVRIVPSDIDFAGSHFEKGFRLAGQRRTRALQITRRQVSRLPAPKTMPSPTVAQLAAANAGR